jgi:hypothetical protein
MRDSIAENPAAENPGADSPDGVVDSDELQFLKGEILLHK